MSKKILTSLLLIILGFGLSGCTLFKPKSTSTEESSGSLNTSQGNTHQNTEKSISGTLTELLKIGKNLKCTATMENENANVKAETFIMGNKFRSDSSITQKNPSSPQDVNLLFHMVSDGNNAYMWSDDKTQPGIKMSFKEFENNSQQAANPETQAAAKASTQESLKNYKFNCDPWIIVDNSKFDVPTNIEFQDLTEMINQLANPTSEGNASMCKICDSQKTEEEKQSCKTALKCQ